MTLTIWLFSYIALYQDNFDGYVDLIVVTIVLFLPINFGPKKIIHLQLFIKKNTETIYYHIV
jgi:hypothetical protein